MKKLKIKKSILFLIILCLGLCFCTSCGNKKEEKEADPNRRTLYYLNPEENGLVKVKKSFELPADIRECASVIIDTLGEVEAKYKEKYHPVKNKQVSIEHISSFEDGTVTVDFGPGYLQMDSRQEILFRAAIVKSLVQAEQISYVYFTVSGEPLTNESGIAVGIMSDNTFILDNDKKNVYDTSQTVTLYYANKQGDGLVAVSRELEAKDNESMESAVIAALKYSEEEEYHRTIPLELVVNHISVIQNICYVDFSEEILAMMTGIEEEVKFYSIINSLISLERITQVQITVEGEVMKEINGVTGLDRPLACEYSLVTETK